MFLRPARRGNRFKYDGMYQASTNWRLYPKAEVLQALMEIKPYMTQGSIKRKKAVAAIKELKTQLEVT